MKLRHKQTILRLIAVVALAMMATFGYSLAFNLHLHVTPEGRLTVHSHPYGEESDQGQTRHSHSDSERIFIFHLGNLIDSTLLPALLVLFGILYLALVRPPALGGLVGLLAVSRAHGRAPPISLRL